MLDIGFQYALNRFIVGPAVNMISSFIPQFNFNKGPVGVFSLDIDTEYFQGRYFARYKPTTMGFGYNYLENYNKLCENFERQTQQIFDAKGNFDPKVLENCYLYYFNQYKPKNVQNNPQELCLHSFDRFLSSSMSELTEHVLVATGETTRILGCMLNSFKLFSLSIDKKEHWLSASRVVIDLIRCLCFIQEKYDFFTEKYIFNILEIMKEVEINSENVYDQLVAKSGKYDLLNLENKAYFAFFDQYAIRMEEEFNKFSISAEKLIEGDPANHLPFFYVINRFQCLISILFTISDLPHKIVESNDINVTSSFLCNLTSSFVHLFLSHLDLNYSMMWLIYDNATTNLKSLSTPWNLITQSIEPTARALRGHITAPKNPKDFNFDLLGSYDNFVSNFIWKYYYEDVIHSTVAYSIDKFYSNLEYDSKLPVIIENFYKIMTILLSKDRNDSMFHKSVSNLIIHTIKTSGSQKNVIDMKFPLFFFINSELKELEELKEKSNNFKTLNLTYLIYQLYDNNSYLTSFNDFLDNCIFNTKNSSNGNFNIYKDSSNRITYAIGSIIALLLIDSCLIYYLYSKKIKFYN